MNRGVRERFGQWYNEIGGCMQLDTVVIRNLFAVERLAATWMLLHDCLCTAIVNGANSCRECLYVHGFMDGFTELHKAIQLVDSACPTFDRARPTNGSNLPTKTALLHAATSRGHLYDGSPGEVKSQKTNHFFHGKKIRNLEKNWKVKIG